ncbi:MAG TPA: hypothetical protein VFZ65_10775 [Planctomycetota bacterium]|nr:hypothetical protein [Planctomycetota bacterium]
MTPSPVRPFGLVLVPAALTLAVTLLRLAGELRGWPTPWVSKAPGGGGALIGITWLVPVFGAWFGWRLAGAGGRPSRPGRALLLHVAALVVYIAGFQVIGRVPALDGGTAGGLVAQILTMGGVSVLAMLLAFAAWPRLCTVDLVYALLARAPTALITFLAVFGDWGTHFEQFGRNDYHEFGPWPHAALLAFAQLVFWPAFTAAVGGLFGTLAAMLRRKAA